MRPVELRLSGLHSYREEQVVDFAALCAHGIFGIFGATGSGKSTLLDAIILALFGEVPRASHGTQGIINQRLDEARVAFTFDLGRGAERRRYRVERVLRRSGEFGAATARCRLVLLDGPAERVLAEKDGQVKGALREIVGLNASDFTRAVVLPQGRFAEFLTLTPALRREMMERLFELERFGEKLRQRTDAALGEAQEALGRVRAEQEGLGNCSPAAVAQARRELEASRAAARQAGDAYRAALRRREEAAAVVQLQERRDAYRRRLAELEGREAEVALLEAKLGAAERAEGLRSLLEQQDRLQEDLFRRRELLAALARREEEAAAAAARAAEEAAARRRHRATEEPRLVEERG
ncbi:MAG: AAA family ATPase, partial [Bacillota bacterium]